MAYAGLSGGFGTLTLGQIWNAGYNHVGAITDKSWFYGNSHTGYRHGSAVSYATSAGAVSLQLDAILDGAKDSGDAVDKLEFGMTVDLGDIGKVALAYTDEKDYTTKVTMYDSVSVSEVGGSIENTLTGTIMNTVTGEIENSVSIGDINSQLQGEVNTEITGIELMGGLTAQVALTGWMDPMGMGSMVPQGDCTTYVDGTRQDPTITTESMCDDLNDEDADTVAVWAVDTNLSQIPVENSDSTIADDSPTAVTINISGVDNISEVTNIKHLDEDGNELTRTTRWAYVSGTRDNDSETSAHAECSAREAGSDLVCEQVIQYLDADGMNVAVDMRTGTIDLGSGTLDVTGGDLVITNADGDETTIHEALSVMTTITGTTVDSDISDLGVDSDTSGLGVDSDISGLTVDTDTTTTAVMKDKMHTGSKKTHVAAEFNLGAVTGHLGYSQIKANGSTAKTKVTHYGVTGGLGDSGMSFLIQARNVDGADGSDSDPWLVALTKGLGGGATVMVEHGNDDDGESGKTRFGLKVDF